MNLAAIDIGTNSVRLLVVDGARHELARPMRMTRLGQGVDVTGRLDDAAMARTLEALREFRATLDRHAVERLRVTATSAARDAQNSAQFFDAAERVLGARPELLSGADEARLSFQGATQGLPDAEAPFLIIDLGGGSTELVLGVREPEALISLQLGCVRMTERHLRSDPPAPAELSACVSDVRRELARARGVIDPRKARTCVGLAGTVTALAALELGLRSYDASRTHHSRLTRQQVSRGFAALSSASVVTRRDMLAEPARAEVIVGGAAVLATLMQEFDIDELLVSEKDILDGLTESLA